MKDNKKNLIAKIIKEKIPLRLMIIKNKSNHNKKELSKMRKDKKFMKSIF